MDQPREHPPPSTSQGPFFAEVLVPRWVWPIILSCIITYISYLNDEVQSLYEFSLHLSSSFSLNHSLPMSQLSIQGTDDLVTLSLHKFSYATTVHERANPRWTHCTGKEKFAVFDHVTVQDVGGFLTKKRLLKVVIGGETLVGSDQIPASVISVFRLHGPGTFVAMF